MASYHYYYDGYIIIGELIAVEVMLDIRVPAKYEKLSDQFVYWAKFRYTPKGQLGKIS